MANQEKSAKDRETTKSSAKQACDMVRERA